MHPKTKNCISCKKEFTSYCAVHIACSPICRIKNNTKINTDRSYNGIFCLEFTGNKNETGYGRINIRTNGKNKLIKVHRYVYEYYNGEIESGNIIRHLCHNRACCNQKHLKQGTQQDNANDASLWKKDGRPFHVGVYTHVGENAPKAASHNP